MNEGIKGCSWSNFERKISMKDLRRIASDMGKIHDKENLRS